MNDGYYTNLGFPFTVGTYLEDNNMNVYKLVEYRINENGIYAVLLENILNEEITSRIINLFELSINYKRLTKTFTLIKIKEKYNK